MEGILAIFTENPLLLPLIIGVPLLFLMMKNEKNKLSDKLADALRFSDEIEEEIILTKSQLQQVALNKKLEKAGIPLKAHEFTRFRLILTAIFFVIVYICFKNPVLTSILTGGFFFLPPLAVSLAENKKREKFELQLPGALSLLRNSVEAGMSFLQSMELVAEEMDPPISEEFAKVIHESQVGVDLRTSFERMNDRVDSTELELMTIAVLIQREVGGNLAEILDTILQTIRERIQLKGEIKALTAQGKLSAVIIGGLPVALAVIMNMINGEYMSPLFTTTIGQILIGFCVVLMGVGIWLMMKICQIDF